MPSPHRAAGQRNGRSLQLNDDKERDLAYTRIVVRLFGYLLRYRTKLAVTTAAMFVYSGTVVALPWVVKLTIDLYIANESGDTSGLTGMVVLYVLVAVVQFAAGYVHRRILVQVGQQMLYSMRMELFDQLQRLSTAFFDQNRAGKIMSRIQNDVEEIQELIIIFVITVANLVSVVGIAAAMMLMNMPLALITFAVVLVLIPALSFWQRLARGPYQRVRRAIAEVNSQIQENIVGIRVVQSLNRQDVNASHFEEANHDHLSAGLQSIRYWAGLFPTVETLAAAALVLVIAVGGNMVLGGSLEVGVVVAFALHIERLFNPVQDLTLQFDHLQKAMVSADRIFELLDVEPDVSDRPDALVLPPVRGDVRFEGVQGPPVGADAGRPGEDPGGGEPGLSAAGSPQSPVYRKDDRRPSRCPRSERAHLRSP